MAEPHTENHTDPNITFHPDDADIDRNRDSISEHPPQNKLNPGAKSYHPNLNEVVCVKGDPENQINQISYDESDTFACEGKIVIKEEFCRNPPLHPILALTKRRRTVLNLAEKADLLRRLHEGTSQKQLALEYGIGTSTVSDLKKHEAEILGFVASNGDEAALARRKLDCGARNDVEEAVVSWLHQEAGSGREVTGREVQARARQESQRLRGDQQFLASPGWLERFRRRYNLRPGRAKRGRRRGRQARQEWQESPPPAVKSEVQEDEDCETEVCPEAVQPLVSVEEGHVSVQLPPVQDVPSAAEAAALLSRALVWAAAQQDTTPQQLFVIKQLQTRAALRGIMKGGI